MGQSIELSDQAGSDKIKRCDKCESLMCYFMYKHNGIEKTGYRCPSPHGLRSDNKKEATIVDTLKIEEIEID